MVFVKDGQNGAKTELSLRIASYNFKNKWIMM
jgi:hypothetical protein